MSSIEQSVAAEVTTAAPPPPVETRDDRPAAPSPVNYEGTPVCEVTLDDTDYRFDAGKQGTAVSLSTRPSGTWDWTFRGEARWDGSALRSKAFERNVLLELSVAFKRALAELE